MGSASRVSSLSASLLGSLGKFLLTNVSILKENFKKSGQYCITDGNTDSQTEYLQSKLL